MGRHTTISNSQQWARHLRGRAASAAPVYSARTTRKEPGALPCPFCGQAPDVITKLNQFGESVSIKCAEERCPASFVMVSTFNDEPFHETLRRWNSRGALFNSQPQEKDDAD